MKDTELSNTMYKISQSIHDLHKHYQEDSQLIEDGLGSVLQMVESALGKAKSVDEKEQKNRREETSGSLSKGRRRYARENSIEDKR